MKKLTSLFKVYCTATCIVLISFKAMAQCNANFNYTISGCTVTFTNTSVQFGTGAAQFTWLFGDGATAATMNASHTYATSDTYTVTLVMSTSTCLDSTSKSFKVTCPTGIDEFQSLNALVVLANPVHSSTLIQYNLLNAGHVQITVFDLLGNVVSILENSHQNPGDHSLNWNPGTIKSGIYFLQLNAGGNSITQKVVVAKQ